MSVNVVHTERSVQNAENVWPDYRENQFHLGTKSDTRARNGGIWYSFTFYDRRGQFRVPREGDGAEGAFTSEWVRSDWENMAEQVKISRGISQFYEQTIKRALEKPVSHAIRARTGSLRLSIIPLLVTEGHKWENRIHFLWSIVKWQRTDLLRKCSGRSSKMVPRKSGICSVWITASGEGGGRQPSLNEM